MIDFIRNGVTTGGFAPNTPIEPQGENIYNQYLQQVWKERQDAMNKNYDLVKDTDLSKVDPRDRGAVRGLYGQWRQLALNPPQTNRRGDYNLWREQVLQGETDVKNRIGEIISGRQNLVNGYAENKDKLSAKGLRDYNDALTKPVMGEDGKVIYYNPNQFEHAPEKVYDVNGKMGDLLKGATAKDGQVQIYRRGDGKYVQKHADITDLNRYYGDVKNEAQSNPEFQRVFQNQYNDYMAKNRDSKMSMDDFIQHAAQSQLPNLTNYDKQKLHGVNQTPGFLYHNVNEKEPNDYKMTVNNGRSFADQKAEVLANYQNLMGNLHGAVQSGDLNAMSQSAQQLGPFVLGKSLDGNGKVNRIQVIKDANGNPVLRATVPDNYGFNTDHDYPLNDTNTWQKIHMNFNNQFRDKNFGLQVPSEQLNPYTQDLENQQQLQDDNIVSPIISKSGQLQNQVNPVHGQQQQQQVPYNTVQPETPQPQQKGLLYYGKKILGISTKSTNNTSGLDAFAQ